MKIFPVSIGLILVSALSLLGCSVYQNDKSNLPAGIELVPKTDELQIWNPLWSPDGEKIVAGIAWYPIHCYLCETSYSELYLISPSTYSVTSFLREENAYFYVTNWTPDGKKIVVESSESSFGSGVFLIDINDAQSVTVPEHFSDRNAIDWSRDGKKIVMFDWVLYKRRELKIVDLVTDEETLLYTIAISNSDSSELSGPSLSPDGKTIAFSYGKSDVDYHSVDTEIYFLDIETKQIVQFTHDSSHDNDSPRFSPDGKLIAYQRFYQDKLAWRTVIVELDSGCEWEVPLLNAHTSSWAPDSRRLVIGGFGIYIVDLYQLFGEEFVSGTSCP